MIIVHLSTSSSSDRLPHGNWLLIAVFTVILLLISVAYVELTLRAKGFRPSTVDSAELWMQHRELVSDEGANKVVLLGGSRIQLGIDLQALEDSYGAKATQLAIDGNSFLPVLKNIAEDPEANGTFIIAVTGHILTVDTKRSRAREWAEKYQKSVKKSVEPYRFSERLVSKFINSNMSSRLEGAVPIKVVSSLLFNANATGNYLVTTPDRSRDADYQLVDLPSFYAARVQRHYGRNLIQSPTSMDEFTATYEEALSDIVPARELLHEFQYQVKDMFAYIRAIQARGNKVILVRFPTDKLIWEIDKRRFPREIFWNSISNQHPDSIHFDDYPGLSKFDLPDGSHLDFRDKKEFAGNLMEVINR